MTGLTVCFSPGACSRVTMTALEQIGEPYDARPVMLAEGEHLSEGYRVLNPKGKVPLLITPQGPLSETLAIAQYLHQTWPEAGLMPGPDAYATTTALSWLAWCGTGLHPLVFRYAKVERFHPDPATHVHLRHSAAAELENQFRVADEHLGDGRDWLCGEHWSLADSYLLWAWQRAAQAGFESACGWPALRAWLERSAAVPAWLRALEREASAVAARQAAQS